MAGAAAALIRAASKKGFEGHAVVRIAASEIIGAEVLPSILTDFRTQHPGVIVELSLSDRVEDLLRRDADIAVRMVKPKQGSLVARRIGSVTAGLHAHRRYLHESGQPNNITQLAQHVLIGFDRETASIRAFQRLGFNLRRDDFAFRTDTHLAQLAAIRAGFGIGICQTAIARRDSDLVRVLPNDFAFDLEVWIAMHEDLRATHPMRIIFDYLAEALSDYVRAKGRRKR
jgi:DNA-binding transcriptional LysR family regulator